MKLGVSIPTSHQGVYLPSPFASAPELTSIVRMAERFGFYSAWVLDLMTPSYERHKQPWNLPEWYEAMLSLGYLAGVTEKVRLGTATIQLPCPRCRGTSLAYAPCGVVMLRPLPTHRGTNDERCNCRNP